MRRRFQPKSRKQQELDAIYYAYGTNHEEDDSDWEEADENVSTAAEYLPFFLKYGFALVLTVLAAVRQGPVFLLPCLMELLTIFCLSNRLLRMKHVWPGRIVNALLMLLYNAQVAVLVFGSTYITLVMLTNVDSLQDLSGKAVLYILSAVAILVFSFWPVRSVRFPNIRVMAGALAVELAFTMFIGSIYSPLFDYCTVIQSYRDNQALNQKLEKLDVDPATFEKKGINSYDTDESQKGKNIVLILTEGLSQDIIDDDQNVMPNLKAYEGKSLNFTNYYNHTFATYRGIIGQLYSGYQMENLDENHLVSIQQLFQENGYTTSFINTEPKNAQFSNYLDSMGFDDVVSDPNNTYSGQVDSLSDKEAYSTLFDTMEEKSKSGQPFFTAIYTFGTHLSFDSTDETFGDGSNALLNKFYNLDHQFGEFMKKFEKSDLADNTVIVFTTDHTTYIDDSYKSTFPELCTRPGNVGKIPLFIYYPGIKAETVDVEGRNSIDMAPTVCDYMSISGKNYFLGESLFSPTQNNNNYDTFFTDSEAKYKTAGGELSKLSDSEASIFDTNLQNYYALKLVGAG